MMLEHVVDYRRVKKITDANPMEVDNPWRLIISREIYYLLEVQENGKDVGVFCFEPSDGEYGPGYSMHVSMTPECRGRKVVRAGLDAISWLFDHTEAQAVYAGIPVDLKHAHVIPVAAGLKSMGAKDGLRWYIMLREEFMRKVA